MRRASIDPSRPAPQTAYGYPMFSSLFRVICIATVGAIAGGTFVALAFVISPDFTLEMDRDLPRNVSGIYPPEYDRGGPTFAWTARSAKVSLPGLDRRVAWACSARLRGGRTAPLEQPVVEFGVDGLSAAIRTATNVFEDLQAEIPPSKLRKGAILTLTSSTTFVPGPGDPRQLGIQIDRLQCRPAGAALPPRRAYMGGISAGALFGAGFAMIGITTGSAAGAVVLLMLAQAFPLASGAAPYGAYADRAAWLALWIAGAMVLVVRTSEWPGRPRLRQTARFVIAFSASVLFLKLLGLLHPSKALVDAVFQAHRLEWVLGGRYYFTQLMPSGVEFPYAIGLYVVAAPWSAWTRDHVTLLRLVVCAAECIAGASLYPMIVRTWGDRLAGAMAVALFAVVPTAYWVVGNANLTNAFGQSVALMAIALVVIWSQRAVRARHVVGWAVVASLALLSHVSTFATLVVTLLAIAVLFRLAGSGTLRMAARGLLVACIVATAFSVVTYYGHFGDVYVKALRVRGGGVSRGAGPPAAVPETSPLAPPAPREARPAGAKSRAARSLAVAGQAIGWPILVLAVVGGWSVRRRPRGEPLLLTLGAWAAAFLLFFGVGLMRVETQFERYSLEFVQRVTYAASPAFVILAGAGAAWAWRSGRARRAFSVLLVALAMSFGFREWSAWW